MDANELRKRRDKAPFDGSYIENYKMYDRFPYTMDLNICPKDNHKLLSGNIIKYSTYNIKDVLIIKTIQ